MLDSTTLLGFVQQLRAVFEEKEDVTIDFSDLVYAFPIGILIFGRNVRRFASLRRARNFETIVSGHNKADRAVIGYLNHVGFFSFILLAGHPELGAAKGSGRYIPIRRVARPEQFVRGSSAESYAEAVKEAEGLAGLLVGGVPETWEAYQAFVYCFKEILRNVFEHSNAGAAFVVGQRWQNGSVEVAVMDEGRGIRASLAESFPLVSDDEAVRHAVLPGVSRTTKSRQNLHDNSGFGLFVLSEMGRCYGEFTLGSNTAMLTIARDKPLEMQETYHRGTYVGLKMTQFPHNFSSLLDDIIESGERDAAIAGMRAKASASSRDIPF
ncbi:MAG: ATP-binding protein [Opitutaceae bacterium]